MKDLEFEYDLYNILNKYTENQWKNEPLDIDEVDSLCNILKNQLNLINGNITNKEYLEIENY